MIQGLMSKSANVQQVPAGPEASVLEGGSLRHQQSLLDGGKMPKNRFVFGNPLTPLSMFTTRVTSLLAPLQLPTALLRWTHSRVSTPRQLLPRAECKPRARDSWRFHSFCECAALRSEDRPKAWRWWTVRKQRWPLVWSARCTIESSSTLTLESRAAMSVPSGFVLALFSLQSQAVRDQLTFRCSLRS